MRVMTIEDFKNKSANIKHFEDKLGEIIFDEFNATDNFTADIGRYTLRALNECETERELKIANDILVGVCGWGIATLIEKIKKRDEGLYCWASVDEMD